MADVKKIETLRRGTIVYLGADPELFVVRGEKEWVVGSERILAEPKVGYLARDGIQIEFHFPAGITCREGFASTISSNMTQLRNRLNELNKSPKKYLENLKISFKTMVRVTPAELNRLSPDSRVLGCSPSLNIYEEKSELGVNPATYRIRTAGGHIHLGFDNNSSLKRPENVRRIIKVLDVILGNTSVLIDRDPNAAKRRKVYGRAGEYRIPSYGLEYRTLSNFWLRSYALTSMILGIARMAPQIIAQTEGMHEAYSGKQYTFDVEKALLSRVDIEKVRRAINTNDPKLAWENFKGFADFLEKHTVGYGDGVYQGNLHQFKFFLKQIEAKGLEFWFPTDPVTHWTGSGGRGNGCENFLQYTVGDRLLREPRPDFRST